MLPKLTFCLSTLGTCVVPFVAVYADGDFRCPKSGKIVHEGDSQYEVESKCGPASSKSPVAVTIQGTHRAETAVQVEVWTYDFGPNAFTQNLRFEGDRLVKVTRGDYGTRPAHEKLRP